MKLLKKILVLSISFVFTVLPLYSKKISIDTKKSIVLWKGSKIFFDSHNGKVNLKKGFIKIKKDQIIGGEFVLDMKTIVSHDLSGKWKNYLEEHLKGDDFFYVSKYPTATFKILSAQKKDNYYDIQGSLTMRGKTNDVSFKAKIDLKKYTALATLVLNRQKWGVSYKGKKDNLIKDEIEINLKIQGK